MQILCPNLTSARTLNGDELRANTSFMFLPVGSAMHTPILRKIEHEFGMNVNILNVQPNCNQIDWNITATLTSP